MSNLGFKRLSAENWLTPDSTVQAFVRIAPDGSTHNISGEEWLRDILHAQIHESVPLEIRKMFEVARGVMAYGYYFYPIYTLGIGQLFRVVESAVSLKCEMLAAPSSVKTFNQKITWLTQRGVIPENKSLHWTGLRKLRNLFAHPEMQSIYMPIEALKYIASMSEDINSLFSRGV